MTPPWRLKSISTFPNQQTLLQFYNTQIPASEERSPGIRETIFLDQNGSGNLEVNGDLQLDYSELRPAAVPKDCIKHADGPEGGFLCLKRVTADAVKNFGKEADLFFKRGQQERNTLPDFSGKDGWCSFKKSENSTETESIFVRFSVPLTSKFQLDRTKSWLWDDMVKATGYSRFGNATVQVDPSRCYYLQTDLKLNIFGSSLSIFVKPVGLSIGIARAEEVFGLNNEVQWLDVNYKRPVRVSDQGARQISFQHVDLNK